MTTLLEPLAWDSEFFGIPIARVDLDDATPETLRQVEAEARELGIACLYGSLRPEEPETPYLVQTFGHRLVEVAVTMSRPAGLPFEPRPTTSIARRGSPDDVPLLAEPLETLVPWTRFAVDPHFGPDAARRMFAAWVERAARSDDDERMLVVAEDDSGVTGCSTHVRAPEPRVDLMGVTKPGSGASWALMSVLLDWAGDTTVYGGPVAARNIAPLRYLEHCGFRMAHVQYRYHRWLDEELTSR